ncbi:hypothetical protein FHG87_011759 [Trinorchestia longiramus]|nr:hypothetical protein FHG87_011759 [Trinorchestia longiramus]
MKQISTALASVTVSNSLCRVVSVRCKALHSDALLVCAAVSNCSSRLLLSDLELVLNLQSEHREDRTSAGKSNHPHLEYKSFVYKSVMRVSKQTSTTAKNKGDCAESRDRVPHGENNASGSGVRLRMGGGESKSATHIEPLIPCLLRPKKQAYVIGVCRMPIFSSGRYLNITGLVRFKTKPLSLQDNKSHLHYSPYSGTTPHSSDNSCVNAADNRSGSTASRDDFSARKRKEFVSRECDSSQKLNPPTASPKEESFSAVEDFICRKGGVYVKSWYPEYAGNSTDCVYQVPIKTISIDALRIDAMKVSLTAPPPKAGVSLDSLALISGSERCKVLLQSPICGLSIDRLLSELAQRCDIRQVADVDNVYVLCAADSSASLHHCALSLSQQEQRCVSADLYFRDVRQGLMLVHTLKAVLPFDATICPAEAGMPSRRDACVLTAAVDPVQLLHEKMRKTAQFLSRGIRNKFSLRGDREEEQTKKKSKLAKDSKFHETRSVGEIYDEERKLFESRATFMVDRANYEEWRLQLETLLAEFHEAYLQAHECEQ